MTISPGTEKDALFNLADALSRDILSAPKHELLAEAAEDYGDSRALANAFNQISGVSPSSCITSTSPSYSRSSFVSTAQEVLQSFMLFWCRPMTAAISAAGLTLLVSAPVFYTAGQSSSPQLVTQLSTPTPLDTTSPALSQNIAAASGSTKVATVRVTAPQMPKELRPVSTEPTKDGSPESNSAQAERRNVEITPSSQGSDLSPSSTQQTASNEIPPAAEQDKDAASKSIDKVAEQTPKENLDVRHRYEEAQRIGSKEAWETFIRLHPNDDHYTARGKQELAKLNTRNPAAPATLQRVAASNPNHDVRRDYELAVQIGTKEALESFMKQHPNGGLYTLFTKQTLAKLDAPPSVPAGSLGEPQQEQLAWDRIRTSDDRAVFRDFLVRFPNGSRALEAQHRLEILEKRIVVEARLAHERDVARAREQARKQEIAGKQEPVQEAHDPAPRKSKREAASRTRSEKRVASRPAPKPVMVASPPPRARAVVSRFRGGGAGVDSGGSKGAGTAVGIQ
jgi:hypothetical protein